jgi:hypothetical protein
MIPVVIGTNPERGAWLDDCLKSIRATTRRRRVLIHRTGGYEPAALRTGCATFSRFVFLHDSVTILHPDFWAAVDASGPAWLAGAPHMNMGIFDSAALSPLLPDTEASKDDAIRLENDLPMRLPGMGVLWPDVIDTTHLRMESRHGRMNLVLGNHLFEKHKGSWGQT